MLRTLHGILCNMMGALLSFRRIADRSDYFKRISDSKSVRLKAMLGKMLCFASLDTWAYWNEKAYSLCKNNNSKCISVPTDRKHYFGEVFERGVVSNTIDHVFEDCNLKLPEKYDYYLSKRYGDYMVIPPRDKQVLSVYSKLDLGPYEPKEKNN